MQMFGVIVIAAIIFAGFVLVHVAHETIVLYYKEISELMSAIIYSVGGILVFLFVRFCIWKKRENKDNEDPKH